MKVLGSLSAGFLANMGATVMGFTVVTCYAVAVSLGHVEPWLPTISSCGDHVPEEFLFRFGIFVSALLLEIEAFALYLSKKASGVTFTLGAVAAFCLAIVAVVGANELDPLHLTAAIIFFVLENMMIVLLTVDTLSHTSCSILIAKIFTCIVACVSTIMRLLVGHSLLTMESVPIGPIFEWTNTAAVLVFHLILSATEFPSLAVGIIDTNGSNLATPKTPPTVVTHKPLDGPQVYNKVVDSHPPKEPVVLGYLSKDSP